MGTLTQAETKVVPFSEVETSNDKDDCSHIVKTEKSETATALVLRSRVDGTPVEALCGYIWVPSKNPERLPVCPQCDEIYQLYRMNNEGLHAAPKA